AAAAGAQASRFTIGPARPIAELPFAVGGWSGVEGAALDDGTVRALGADRYVNRSYSSPTGSVGLYIAYYASQRPGVSIHSPLHCLPGTGWEPLDVATLRVDRPEGPPTDVRRMVVRKNLD